MKNQNKLNDNFIISSTSVIRKYITRAHPGPSSAELNIDGGSDGICIWTTKIGGTCGLFIRMEDVSGNSNREAAWSTRFFAL